MRNARSTLSEAGTQFYPVHHSIPYHEKCGDVIHLLFVNRSRTVLRSAWTAGKSAAR
jgi:hypothetical protein